MSSVSKTISVSYRTRHKTSPFPQAGNTYNACVYAPSEYTLSVILALPARALRVLCILAARYDPATGLCHCSKVEIRRLTSMSNTNISHAAGELVEANLIAKGKGYDTYYINPGVFTPVSLLR